MTALLFAAAPARRVAAAPATPIISADVDTDLARQHFAAGLRLYDKGRFENALGEFDAARRLKPLPALDYNIGRCQERLERWADAASSYRRFLARVPEDPQSKELVARLGVLDERARTQRPAASTSAPAASTGSTTPVPLEGLRLARAADPGRRRALGLGLGLGLGAAALLGLGLGLGLSMGGPHDPNPTLGSIRW